MKGCKGQCRCLKANMDAGGVYEQFGSSEYELFVFSI